VGATQSSATVAITAVNNVPPTAVLTAPVSGQSFFVGQPVTLAANASDSDGTVSKVEFLVDGLAIGALAMPPFTQIWTPVAVGSHNVQARATDNVGAVTTSPSAMITVTQNAVPIAAITAPTSNQTFAVGQPITITATASDPDGAVAKLEFLIDGAVIGSVNAPPFSRVWSGATAGTHALAVRATDNVGAISLSTPVTITVNSGIFPVVALTSPVPGDTFTAGGTIILSAAASSAGGAIVKVDFYSAGTTLLGSVTTAPYVLSWAAPAPGTYSITAKATDARGAVATSASVNVRAITPALIITSPGIGASLPADFMTVTGTYQAPSNSGVTVNGVAARNDGQGNFAANDIPLAAGVNTLTVTLTTADGRSTTQTRLVNSSTTAPMQIYADPDVGFAPATFTIGIKNRTAHAIATVAYTNLGSGQFDGSRATQAILGRILYAVPGLYTPTFTVTDEIGNRYTQTVALLVRVPSAVDQTLKAVWQRFRNALAVPNKAAAMQFLTAGAQVTYGPTFDALLAHLPAITSTWSSPQASLVDEGFAEYGINRTIGGVDRVFLIDFVLDDDGVWRIDAM
jgi:hypothetical protein